MVLGHIPAARDSVHHHVNVLFVDRACPDVVVVRKSVQKVSRSCAAVPDVVFVLPCLAQDFRQVFLRLLHPNLRREEAALAFANVLRNKKVAARDDVVPVFLFRRTRVDAPEFLVGFLPVVKSNAHRSFKAQLVDSLGKLVFRVFEHDVKGILEALAVFGKKVGKEKVRADDSRFFRALPVHLD